MRDFTIEKYIELCKAIKGNYQTYTVHDFIKKKPKRAVILRHDVDRNPKNALRLAKEEKKLGICSTFYFRYPKTFRPKIISQIHKMGHEIGYHYEVLDKANGDKKMALELFREEFRRFRRWGAKTIAMHGNPFKSWSNRDIWAGESLKRHGVLAEAYLSFDATRIAYFTDTGRSWNDKRFNLKDHFGGQMQRIKDTDELISLMKKNKMGIKYISTHPERWSSTYVAWIAQIGFQSLKNMAKLALSIKNG